MTRALYGILLAALFTLPGRACAEDWSPYQPVGPANQPLPAVGDPAWSENPLDVFIYARLQREGLAPPGEIGRREWLRRVTFDLLGLPPTPKEIADLLNDPRPDAIAYAAVVDRLLASPHYGERWARHWLDVVRYADTDGFAIDAERPRLWRYRDYVIRHFNTDRPYEQFIREQIAGDELELGSEGLIATSFYRLGPYEADNMVPENRQQDFLNEITSTIGTAFLGLTVGCARCHDHKYDPIPQADFYQLQAFIAAAALGQKPADFLPEELGASFVAQKTSAEAELAARKERLESHRERLRTQLARALGIPKLLVTGPLFTRALAGEKIPRLTVTAGQPIAGTTPNAGSEDTACAFVQLSAVDRQKLEMLSQAVAVYQDIKRYEPAVDTIFLRRSRGAASKTHILLNGDPFSPGDVVRPGCLTAVTCWSDELAQKIAACESKAEGRRRVLAEWLASAHNPLTMRVYVNRIWQYHFGAGIVQTANDFGANGSGASHPELLDYLTRWFIDHGQRTKPLHRLIVLSRTYRSSSTHAAWTENSDIDAENRLLWHAPLRRLEAEVVRDTLLAISGRLNSERGGPGFYELLPEGMPSEYSFFQWHASPEPQRLRRSIYMYQRRNLVHPFMEAFDVADSSQSCERRVRSVTASQSLTLMNGQLTLEASQHLAQRLQHECAGDSAAQIASLFELALARRPTPEELGECDNFLSVKTHSYASQPAERLQVSPQLLALRDLCLVVLNSNEFLYLD